MLFRAMRIADTPSSLMLAGSNIVLRPFGPEDINAEYLSWLNDPLVVRFSNQRFQTHDRSSSQQYLASFSGTDSRFFSVRRKKDDAAIGTMTAYFSRVHGTADVGLLIGASSSWGKGYGLDSWSTLCDWLLYEQGIRKLTAGTAAPNTAMVRIMEHYGMHHEATRKSQEIFENKAVDIVYYAKFRDA